MGLRSPYNSRRWRSLARDQLRREPLCRMCRRPARVADHIVPHRGDPGLFWDPENLQSLCTDDHNRKTHLEQGHAVAEETGLDGWRVEGP